MRLGSGIAPIIALIVLGGASGGCGGGQERAAGGAVPSATQAASTARSGTPGVSMEEMTDRMRAITREMSSMVAELPGGQALGMGPPQGEMEGAARMAAMTASMNDLADSMTQVMRQMESIVADRELMQQPAVARGLARMQLNLGAMIDGFSDMVSNLQGIQGQPQQPQ